MALSAYLALGAAMASSLPATDQHTSPVMTDRQAVLRMTHRWLGYLGAEQVARELMKVPALMNAALNFSPQAPWILE
jgi:hypothetical protein